MKDHAPSSDGSVSPTSMTSSEKLTMSVNAQSQPLNSSATNLPPVPSWHGPAVATGRGLASDPFTMMSSGSLRGGASSFQPGPEQVSSKMRILSLNSVDDDGPTIVSSVPARGSAQEPIGTKGSGNNSPVRPKGCFSTDVNPEKPVVGGHFIMIQGLKAADVDDGVMTVIQNEYDHEIRGKKIIEHDDDGSEVDMLLFIDDLRKSRKVVAELDSVGNITVSHVSHDWYAAGGKAALTNSIEPKSMYVGQVTFVAEFKGRTADFKSDENVWVTVKDFAESFGSVLAFDQNKSAPYPTWQFRVEYHKISDADKATAAAADAAKLGEAKGWVVTAKQYAPPSYAQSPAGATSSHGSSDSSQTAVVPQGAKVFTSPTGRTAWYIDGDGNNHALPAPMPPSPERAYAETSIVPYQSNDQRFDNGYTATPRGHRAMGRIDSRDMHHNWSLDAGYHDPAGSSEFFQRDARGRLADVAIDRILAGHDVRTTVMLRNVPNDWDWEDVRALLDQVVPDRYNFMYLRIDFKVGKNVGYAFINFESALDIVQVVHSFVGKPWNPADPQYHKGQLKTIQLSYATIQGLDSLVDKFRNSSIMDEMVNYRPLLLQTHEEKAKDEAEAQHLAQRGMPAPAICPVGERKNFPAPNNRAKKERSTANAALLGLFTPRNRGPGHERAYRSQYDRGTPAQLMEDASHFGFSPYGPPPYMMGPPTANYTYGPPRAHAVHPPSFAPGFPSGCGFMTAPAAPAILPRGSYMPETPTRPFGNGRAGMNNFQYSMGFTGSPGWNGPMSHPVNGFPAGHQNQNHSSGMANGAANDYMSNGAARGHSSI